MATIAPAGKSGKQSSFPADALGEITVLVKINKVGVIMPSIIWGRNPQEAYKNPYEYDAQNQFVREAEKVLNGLFEELNKYSRTFKRDDVSPEKAIWMLQVDAVDSLRDCLKLLNEKKHRIASRLFRDVQESLDLASFFFSETQESKKHLAKWYKDEIVSNRVYRDFIRKNEGEEKAKSKAEFYRTLSKLNHRTYRTLAYGYILGKNSSLVYEGTINDSCLVLPQTIAMYYALLADFIDFVSEQIIHCRLVEENVINEIWNDSLENETVPRRFALNPW